MAKLVVYVDVDDTLIRSFGSKRIPMPRVVEHVLSLHGEGATLYCWSSGGAHTLADYRRSVGLDRSSTDD